MNFASMGVLRHLLFCHSFIIFHHISTHSHHPSLLMSRLLAARLASRLSTPVLLARAMASSYVSLTDYCILLLRSSPTRYSKVLTIPKLNPHLVTAEYAVRGAIPIRAAVIEEVALSALH